MKIDFNKMNGLIPAIIQDNNTGEVLMLGYMNEAAIEKTQQSNRVHFFSRSKDRLWMKGESSGNVLDLISMKVDCDGDALLVKVNPTGPTCHTGDETCWGNRDFDDFSLLKRLESVIDNRASQPNARSYVSSLFEKGINKIAQKVGEEAVEVVIEAKDDQDDLFLNESADLLFHYLILLRAKNFELKDVLKVLASREQ